MSYPVNTTWLCLRCGWRGKLDTNRERAHGKRCDFTLVVRTVDEWGRITDGERTVIVVRGKR